MGNRRLHTGFWWRDPGGNRSRCKRKDNIKMDLDEVVWEGMDWIVLAEYRDRYWVLVNAVMNLADQQNFGNFLTS